MSEQEIADGFIVHVCMAVLSTFPITSLLGSSENIFNLVNVNDVCMDIDSMHYDAKITNWKHIGVPLSVYLTSTGAMLIATFATTH